MSKELTKKLMRETKIKERNYLAHFYKREFNDFSFEIDKNDTQGNVKSQPRHQGHLHFSKWRAGGFFRRAAIFKIVEEKALRTRLC